MAGAPPIAPKKFLTNQGENTLSKRLETPLESVNRSYLITGSSNFSHTRVQPCPRL